MITRRTLLKTVAVTGVATVFTGTIGALSAFASNNLRVRRSLETMPLNDPDLEAYRDFVTYMKGQAQSKPVSWLQYSLIHGNTKTGRYHYCPHGDWYFLPWHREFLLMYENAVRELTRYKGFAMPYWNWTAQRRLPEAFANKNYRNSPNPLFVPNRNELIGQYALTNAIVGPELFTLPGDPNYSPKSVYYETNFEAFGTTRNPDQDNLDMKWVVKGGGFQGKLESTPHNMVHNNIGAYMPTAGSPRDPIFMMHHSHIDGIWARWNALGRTNSTDKLWLDMNFKENFISPNGQKYSKKVNELLSTKALGYTYDNLPARDESVVDKDRSQNMLSLFSTGVGIKVSNMLQRHETKSSLTGNVIAPLKATAELRDSTIKSMTIKSAEQRAPEIFALIKGIMIGKDIHSIRVFVNHDNLSISTKENDPHFVTTMSFLKHAKNSHKAMPSVIVNLTTALKRLAGLKLLNNDKISIQLIPVPNTGTLIDKIGAVTAVSIEIVAI